MEVLNEVNKSYPDLPVVLMSTYTDNKEVTIALESGLVRHYISKPFSITDLIELLNSLDIKVH